MALDEDHNQKTETLLQLATEIVAAYVSHNQIPMSEISNVIKSVHQSLGGLVNGGAGESLTPQKPAVPVKRSVTPDYIVCLEDGARLKMLKRYLRSKYNLTPEEYRAKWGLTADYPMVAPNYAAQRSEFAKKIGLGRIATSPVKGRRRRAA
jgi:predicted transcriptional regulator